MTNIPSAQSMRHMADSPFTPPCSFHNDGKYSAEIVEEVSRVFETSYADALIGKIEESARGKNRYIEVPYMTRIPADEVMEKKLTLLYYFIYKTFTIEGYKVSLITAENPPYPILLRIEW